MANTVENKFCPNLVMNDKEISSYYIRSSSLDIINDLCEEKITLEEKEKRLETIVFFCFFDKLTTLL